MSFPKSNIVLGYLDFQIVIAMYKLTDTPERVMTAKTKSKSMIQCFHSSLAANTELKNPCPVSLFSVVLFVVIIKSFEVFYDKYIDQHWRLGKTT